MNDSLAVQYLDYLHDAIRGDFSVSFTGIEVNDILPPYLIGTVFLLLVVVLVSVLVGGPIVSLLSRRKGQRSSWASSLTSVALASLPVTGFAMMVLLLYNGLTGQNYAAIIHRAAWWHSWSSAVDLVQSSVMPLLVSLVPTLGMYLVLSSYAQSGERGGVVEASVRPRTTGLRRYYAAVIGAAVGTPLFFVSWAMCCVLMAEIACEFDGLGSLMLMTINWGDYPVFAVAVLASSLVTFAAILSFRLMRWLVARRAVDPIDNHNHPTAAVTPDPPGAPRSMRTRAKEIAAFARSILGGFRRSRAGVSDLALFGILCATAVLAPYIAPVESPWDAVDFDAGLLPPSVEPSEITGIVHLLGTDTAGRDVLSLLLYGSGVTILAVVIVFVVSMTAYLSLGWLRVACAKAPKRAMAMARPVRDAVGMAFLSVPVFVAIFCLTSDDLYRFDVATMAVALAILTALWGWELMPVIAEKSQEPFNHVRDGRPGGRIILADALRSSKLPVLITLPVLAAIPFWDSSDAGLFYLTHKATRFAVDHSCWWIVVPLVVYMLLLTVSAYTVIDVLEGLVRGRPEGAASEQGVLGAPAA
jgi:ABC-type dipeptide/oligopeptide/nickel transport system permease component/ABC-type dipeptide/oligopeptide/nickel transport system permease subunit